MMRRNLPAERSIVCWSVTSVYKWSFTHPGFDHIVDQPELLADAKYGRYAWSLA
jgi:hypothetical protein